MGTQRESPFEILPSTTITSSILPFISSDDWLTFRAVSRSCYEIVHGTTDVHHSFCPICQSTSRDSNLGTHVQDTPLNEENESLWNLALSREYRFNIESENHTRQSIHCPLSQHESFLSTRDIFTASTSFVSWKHWRKIEAKRAVRVEDSDDGSSSRLNNPNRQVVGPYYLRAASLWMKIEAWCDDENASGTVGQRIKASLRPGMDVTGNSCIAFGENHVITALAAVYSFYAGQKEHTNATEALFGAYAAYNFGCAMGWNAFIPTDQSDSTDYFILSADRLASLGCAVLLNKQSGAVLLANERSDEYISATPIKTTDATSVDTEDSLLRWFEEYARRLSTGYYSIGKLYSKAPFPSILRYPVAQNMFCSRAVTRGVEAFASAVYFPFSNIMPGGTYIYSIRLRLLTNLDGDEYVSPEQRGFVTCQLHSRHWIITNQDGTNEEVRGEGVVGYYPLLKPGCYENYYANDVNVVAGSRPVEVDIGTFAYQSCTDVRSQIFAGFLTFVPGSLTNPEGEPFQVRVAPFRLCSEPEYYY